MKHSPTFYILRIEIKGYKSIAFDAPLNMELDDINILLGSNGAGKSNIISFFKIHLCTDGCTTVLRLLLGTF